MRPSKYLLASSLLALSISYAHADIFFNATPSGTGDNVLFNLQPADQTGNPVFGNINNTANTLVRFGGNETLTTPSGGQARIEASDGSLNLLDVSLAAAGTGFDSAVFNLNSVNGTGGSATIFATNQFGHTDTFNLNLTNGENFFTLTTDAVQFLTDVRISIAGTGLIDVRQIRLGEVQTQAVPGPIVGAGIPGLIAACGAMLALARRRRQRNV